MATEEPRNEIGLNALGLSGQKFLTEKDDDA